MLRSSEEWLYGVSLTEPGTTYCDRTTVPVRPPPGPATPGIGVLGPVGWLQQACEEAGCGASPSSQVMTIIPPSAYAGEPCRRGTHVLRKSSTLFRPPGRPSAHPVSWPSEHRSGVMKAKLGVVAALSRSGPSWRRLTTRASQRLRSSMIEWK